MKRFLAALFLLCALPLFAQSTPALKAEQHKATFTILTLNEKNAEGAECSATALSEHVLLTAAHCRIPGGKVYLNQTHAPFNHPLEVSETFYDNQDHMLLVLPGVSFKHFVKYDPADYKPLALTEHYYLWGNPAMLPDQYREGYVTGIINMPSDNEVMVSSPIMMLSGPVVGGDSGSGIFAEDGRLVGVLTWGIENGAFAGMYPLAFTSEQLAQAKGRGTFIYGPTPESVVAVLPEEKEKVSSPAPAPAICFPNFLVFLLAAALLLYIIPPVVKAVKIIFCSIWCVALYAVRLLKTIFSALARTLCGNP
jgi:hypothetical protein